MANFFYFSGTQHKLTTKMKLWMHPSPLWENTLIWSLFPLNC